MVRIILAAVLVVALAMTASAFGARAYDALYSGDTAMTRDAGAFGVDVGFIYLMADKSYDQDGESVDWGTDEKGTGMWFPVRLGYGVADGFEIGATPMFVMNKYEWPSDRTEEIKGTGLTDTWVWAKYMFMPDPMMTARLGVKIATGNDEPDEDELATGSGQMDIDGAIMFGVPAGPGTFDAAVGYRYRLARTYEDARSYDYKPGSEIHFTAGYSYPFSDTMGLGIGVEGFFGSEDEVDFGDAERSFETIEDTAANIVNINPSFYYMMDSGMDLGVDFYYPLMGQNVDAGWGLGLSIGWGM